MKKSQIISTILIKSGVASDVVEANRIFVQAFVDHYLHWNLPNWDRDVPDPVANSYIQNVGTSHGMTAKFLIKDLDNALKKN